MSKAQSKKITCSLCQLDKPRSDFSKAQLSKSRSQKNHEIKCMTCISNMAETNVPIQTLIKCTECNMDKKKSEFSKSQLGKSKREGHQIKCSFCLSKPEEVVEVLPPTTTFQCSECLEIKIKKEYSRSQLSKSKKENHAIKCKSCVSDLMARTEMECQVCNETKDIEAFHDTQRTLKQATCSACHEKNKTIDNVDIEKIGLELEEVPTASMSDSIQEDSNHGDENTNLSQNEIRKDSPCFGIAALQHLFSGCIENVVKKQESIIA